MTHEAADSTIADKRTEERAAAMARIRQKLAGRGTMGGVRVEGREPLPESMYGSEGY